MPGNPVLGDLISHEAGEESGGVGFKYGKWFN
jgi:hypothetical protein